MHKLPDKTTFLKSIDSQMSERGWLGHSEGQFHTMFMGPACSARVGAILDFHAGVGTFEFHYATRVASLEFHCNGSSSKSASELITTPSHFLIVSRRSVSSRFGSMSILVDIPSAFAPCNSSLSPSPMNRHSSGCTLRRRVAARYISGCGFLTPSSHENATTSTTSFSHVEIHDNGVSAEQSVTMPSW